MYHSILVLHSIVRWLVLISLVCAMIWAYRAWRSKKVYTPTDDKIRHWTATIAHLQFTLGMILYFVSPIIEVFWANFSTTVHQRELRFFGMEHSLMMFIAVGVLSTGSALAKRKKTDQQKFKTIAIWFTIALLIILANIPWAFSPLVARPWIRFF